MKAFNIDVERCSGCYCCQFACKDEHVGNDWTPYAKPQPETGHFWLKINEHIRGTQPKVKIDYVPVMCQHCEDAPCISACPIEGAIVQRDDGLVIIYPTKCTGCQLCMTSCPYGAIFYNPSLKIVQKCTGCAHLLDEEDSPIRIPRCVDICPHDGILFDEKSKLDLQGTETLNPEYGLTTRVHYKNLPKRFIAGTVYDPNAKEVYIGATCTLSGDGNATTTTDEFGDFWFEGIGVGNYSVKIEAGGKTKTITDINTTKDVNLGDIPLS